MWRYVNRNLAYWWLDQIKALISVSEQSVLNGLSKNSNQVFLKYDGGTLDITLEENSVFERYFVIRSKGVSVWFVAHSCKNGTWRREFFEVTWQALTIYGKEIFYFLFSELGLVFDRFDRFDICFDLFLKVGYFEENILTDKTKKNSTYTPIRTKKNWVETIYLNERDRKKNSHLLHRIYNKILDSKKKWKLFLYECYKDEETGKYRDVTRFEVEVREDVARYWPFDSLRDDHLLYYRLVKSFWRLNVQFFKFLKDEEFLEFSKEYNRKRKKTISEIISRSASAEPMNKSQDRLISALERKDAFDRYGNDFLNDGERIQCVATMVAMAKRMYKNGFSFEKICEIIRNSIENPIETGENDKKK